MHQTLEASAWRCSFSHQPSPQPTDSASPISASIRSNRKHKYDITTVKTNRIPVYSCIYIPNLWNSLITFATKCHPQKYANSLTFNTSSSKHCSTLTRVLALHSMKRHPYSLAKLIPSFLLTTLSLSCRRCKWHVFICKRNITALKFGAYVGKRIIAVENLTKSITTIKHVI